MEDQQRAELLARRAGDGGTSAAWRGGPDEEAQEASFVSNSRRALEEAFETGSAALASMVGQRERLKARPCMVTGFRVQWRALEQALRRAARRWQAWPGSASARRRVSACHRFQSLRARAEGDA